MDADKSKPVPEPMRGPTHRDGMQIKEFRPSQDMVNNSSVYDNIDGGSNTRELRNIQLNNSKMISITYDADDIMDQ